MNLNIAQAISQELEDKMIAFSTQGEHEVYDNLYLELEDEVQKLWETNPEAFTLMPVLYRAGRCADRLSWSSDVLATLTFAKDEVVTDTGEIDEYGDEVNDYLVEYGYRELFQVCDVYALKAKSSLTKEQEYLIPKAERQRAMLHNNVSTVMNSLQLTTVAMYPNIMNDIAKLYMEEHTEEYKSILESIIANQTHTQAEYAEYLGAVFNSCLSVFNRGVEWAVNAWYQSCVSHSKYSYYGYHIRDTIGHAVTEYSMTAYLLNGGTGLEYLEGVDGMSEEDHIEGFSEAVDYKVIWKYGLPALWETMGLLKAIATNDEELHDSIFDFQSLAETKEEYSSCLIKG